MADKRPGLGCYAEAFLEMTGIMERHAGCTAGLGLGLGQLVNMQHIHQEGADVHDF